MDRSIRLSVVLLLMILSLVTLTGFVGFWLNQQYKEEKTELRKKLEANLADSQRQLVDSLLFKRFIQPILLDSLKSNLSFTPDSIKQDAEENRLEVSRDRGSDVALPKRNMKMNNIRLELSVNDSIFKNGSSGKMKKTLTVVSKDHSGVQKRVIHSSNNSGSSFEFKQDTSNVFLMQGMKLILNEIAGSTNLKINSSGFVQIDSVLFKKTFDKNLKKGGIDLVSRLVPLKKGKNEDMRLETNMFARNLGIEVLDTNWYLLKRLNSRFLFVLVILSMTGLAFLLAYRSLSKQMRLNQMKNDLINNMSHELKTPVATVKVALEALQDSRVMGNEQVSKEYLNMATLELNRLELLLGQVLNSSLLDHKKGFIVKERLVLNKLVEEAWRSIAIRADKQGAKFKLNIPAESIEIDADRTHTLGVILNLLDNALKYAGEHPEVRVELKNGPDPRLIITDSGKGIPEEYIGKVFDKFFRVPNGDVHNTKGFGLGLSYARQVMEQQGGSISVRNVDAGGCEFTLTFA